MASPRTSTIYQLNVTLRESRPLIWRRLQVPSGITLPKLHRALQIAMGWEDYHLHQFQFAGKTYAEPDPEDHHFGREIADERRVRLHSVLSAVGSSFEYLYDFGDDWRHGILLEAILPVVPRKRYPVCLAGARSAPPEDVGGIHGYELYLEALFDPRHPQHRDLLAWRGRFDPEFFPITSVNRRLREEFPAPRRPASGRSLPPASSAFASEFDSIFRSLLHTGRLPVKERVPVGPQEQIPLPLSARDRELICEHSFADRELTERLRLEPETGKPQIFYFTVDELEDLTAAVAAEANHADRKRKPEWDTLYDRLAAVLNQYVLVEPGD
jgi:hypothetical protein